MDPLPSLSKVFNLVTQEEHQRSTITITPPQDHTSNPSMAFEISSSQNSNHKQGLNIHRSYPPRKNRPFCTHCNSYGHTIETCYKIHGYPPSYNKPQRATSTHASTNQVQCLELLLLFMVRTPHFSLS